MNGTLKSLDKTLGELRKSSACASGVSTIMAALDIFLPKPNPTLGSGSVDDSGADTDEIIADIKNIISELQENINALLKSDTDDANDDDLTTIISELKDLKKNISNINSELATLTGVEIVSVKELQDNIHEIRKKIQELEYYNNLLKIKTTLKDRVNSLLKIIYNTKASLQDINSTIAILKALAAADTTEETYTTEDINALTAAQLSNITKVLKELENRISEFITELDDLTDGYISAIKTDINNLSDGKISAIINNLKDLINNTDTLTADQLLDIKTYFDELKNTIDGLALIKSYSFELLNYFPNITTNATTSMIKDILEKKIPLLIDKLKIKLPILKAKMNALTDDQLSSIVELQNNIPMLKDSIDILIDDQLSSIVELQNNIDILIDDLKSILSDVDKKSLIIIKGELQELIKLLQELQDLQ